MSNENSFFSKFTPKSMFFMGLGGGILVLIIVGFFIMLGMFLSDGDNKPSKLAFNDGDKPSAAAPADPSAAPDTNIEVTKDDYIYGDPDAPITLVEFSDFECPFCSRFHPTAKQVVDEYPGQVRWVYKHFPLSSIHQQAQSAAEAVECAGDVGGNDAFWSYGDALFENQRTLGRDTYMRLAGDLGLDSGDFAECIDDRRYEDKVQADYQRGVAAGVRGTPGSFINGQPVSGAVPYEDLKRIVDSLL